MWIGDVGQNLREEINFIPANSGGGQNFGWRIREGPCPRLSTERCPPTRSVRFMNTHTTPATSAAAPSSAGTSTVAGPELQGMYIFGDSETNKIWMFDPADIPESPEDPPLKVTRIDTLLQSDVGEMVYPVSFGEDLDGNLYLTYFFSLRSLSTPHRRVAYGRLQCRPGGELQGPGDTSREVSALSRAHNRATGDVNRDGDVDGNDFLRWQRTWGRALPGAAAEGAEPASYVLAALGMAVVLQRRRRQAAP